MANSLIIELHSVFVQSVNSLFLVHTYFNRSATSSFIHPFIRSFNHSFIQSSIHGYLCFSKESRDLALQLVTKASGAILLKSVEVISTDEVSVILERFSTKNAVLFSFVE